MADKPTPSYERQTASRRSLRLTKTGEQKQPNASVPSTSADFGGPSGSYSRNLGAEKFYYNSTKKQQYAKKHFKSDNDRQRSFNDATVAANYVLPIDDQISYMNKKPKNSERMQHHTQQNETSVYSSRASVIVNVVGVASGAEQLPDSFVNQEVGQFSGGTGINLKPEQLTGTYKKPDVLHEGYASASTGNSVCDNSATRDLEEISNVSDFSVALGASNLAMWVNAPEFIPKHMKPKSYAEAVTSPEIRSLNEIPCSSFYSKGFCYAIDACRYKHGDHCDICQRNLLHPMNLELRNRHIEKCTARHEKSMEAARARERSSGKTCGICMDVVIDKPDGEGRFGILEGCNHCFCLECIRTWRQATNFTTDVIRSCPECRVSSDFVCPSTFWVDTKEDKDKVINNYKQVLSQKHCKHFKRGAATCNFGNKCFYLHALPDGTKVDLGPPLPRDRQQNDEDFDFNEMIQIIFWEMHEESERDWLYSFANDLEEIINFFSDSEDSEWSEWNDCENFFE